MPPRLVGLLFSPVNRLLSEAEKKKKTNTGVLKTKQLSLSNRRQETRKPVMYDWFKKKKVYIFYL